MVKGGLRAIRKRIRAIQNIKKVTRAMKMISSARLLKAEVTLMNARKYEGEILNALKMVPKNGIGGKGGRVLCVVTSDKGLCGAYNSNVIKLAEENINKINPKLIFAFGRKGARYFKRFDLVEFGNFWRDFNFEKVADVSLELLKFEEVFFIWTAYKSRATQIPTFERILPFEVETLETRKRILEPPNVGLELARMFFRAKLWRIFAESLTSEHAMRMRAMDLATENAEEFIKKLTLELNKARQESITRELIDIVGGKEAQEAL